jgi:hypothetical protein
MARTMKKFSAGGAQGRYDRRMKDIEKDYAKAAANKTGKAAEVAEAKRQQRIADAKDDLAKRTGADRSATRAAERTAESNLTKTRKYGAPKAVTTEASASEPKVATIAAPVKSGLATPAKKPTASKTPVKAADKPKPSAADTARGKFFQDSLAKTNFKASARRAEAPIAPSKFDKAAFDKLKAGKVDTLKTDTKAGTLKTGTGTSRLTRAADPKDTSAAASRARAGAALSYLNPFSYIKGVKRQDPSEVNKAKGGKIMKYSKGGSTPPKPTAAERAADAKFRKSVKDIKVTPENAAAIGRGNRSERPGMAKGGKAKAKPFAATKFGAAMKKKSADTKGRAMMKFAKGGSIDGCAVKGKTKASMVKMKKGGSC